MPAKSVGSAGLAARSICPMPDCRDSAAPSEASDTSPLATRICPRRWLAFDAAISRLGLMLFPAPKQALTAVQRVLKPKARIAVLVFTTPSANPFTSQPMQILLRHAGKEPPPPGKPGIFALGGPGVLEGLLADSGLVDVKASVVRAPLRLSSAAEALEMMQQAFGAYRAVVADLDPEARAAAWSEVGKCLRQFDDHEGFHTEVELMIGSGARAA